MRTRSSIPRLSQRKSTGGVGRRSVPSAHRPGSGGDGTFAVLKERPKIVNPGQSSTTSMGYQAVDGFDYYPEQAYKWPGFVLRKGCTSPISNNCLSLSITPRWAIACFKPTYHRLRQVHGSDFESVVDDLLLREAPGCSLGVPTTGAEHELRRRVQLAVAALMNSEGIVVRYPSQAMFPRPARTQQISQPWLRALLTGWI